MAPAKRNLSLEGAAADSKNKRRRIDYQSLMEAVSFSDLPDDCKVNIYSFLPVEDMNSAACCNKNCQQVRTHESLNQQRTGTIVWRESTTTTLFCKKLREVQNAFTGNRTRLKMTGHDIHSGREGFLLASHVDSLTGGRCAFRLAGVTTLDCSCNYPGGSYHPLKALCSVCPNLKDMDLSSTTINACSLKVFAERCPSLSKITWNNGCSGMYQCGHSLEEANNLTEFYANGIEFSPFVYDAGAIYAIDWREWYLFVNCRHLERLSIKGATVRVTEFSEETQPLSQETIIKMVRRHPTLRWLQSDLTADHVAMQKEEHTEITFVSD